jgi:hypothetical protein
VGNYPHPLDNIPALSDEELRDFGSLQRVHHTDCPTGPRESRELDALGHELASREWPIPVGPLYDYDDDRDFDRAEFERAAAETTLSPSMFRRLSF